MENLVEDEDLTVLESKYNSIKNRIDALEKELGIDDYEERSQEIASAISSGITNFMKEFEAEYSDFPFYFNLKTLDVSCLSNGIRTSLKKNWWCRKPACCSSFSTIRITSICCAE